MYVFVLLGWIYIVMKLLIVSKLRSPAHIKSTHGPNKLFLANVRSALLCVCFFFSCFYHGVCLFVFFSYLVRTVKGVKIIWFSEKWYSTIVRHKRIFARSLKSLDWVHSTQCWCLLFFLQHFMKRNLIIQSSEGFLVLLSLKSCDHCRFFTTLFCAIFDRFKIGVFY